MDTTKLIVEIFHFLGINDAICDEWEDGLLC